jgi:hypothetical protein
MMRKAAIAEKNFKKREVLMPGIGSNSRGNPKEGGKMRSKKQVLSLLALVLFFSLLAYGQVKEKGEISGVVTDEEGGPLPGATVTLTGANLFQKSLTAMTDARGVFRFAFLNPGTYAVEISLQGFGSVKYSSILVGAGRTTPIQAKMAPPKLEKEVTVVAKTPLVDRKSVV